MLLRPQWLTLVFLFSLLIPACARAESCKIVDLMPAFWPVVESSRTEPPEQQPISFRHALNLEHTDLYSSIGMGFQSPIQLDAAIVSGLAVARKHDVAIHAMAAKLHEELPAHLAAFQRTFPDFRCNFTIYLAPSLGMMDGAGRIVDGHPALVFGVDNITAEFAGTGLNLNIFLDHELFHRYHAQIAGFSDDNGDQEVIGRALWAEGLATYVSMRMNPPATLQDALFIPTDLVARAQPMLPSLLAQVAPKLGEVDPTFFKLYFNYHHYDTTVPSRSGYYIGALAAERMAQGSSLPALAHMDAAAVQLRLPQILSELGAPKGGSVSGAKAGSK